MKNKTKVNIASNLLQGHNCQTCLRENFCKDSIRLYGSCRRWTDQYELRMKTFKFRARPRKLNVSWTSMADLSAMKNFDAESALMEDIGNEIAEAIDNEVFKNLMGKYAPKRI